MNAWCDFSHHGKCSYLGVYQPPLSGQFIAFSGYTGLWADLGLQPSESLRVLRVGFPFSPSPRGRGQETLTMFPSG